MAAAPEGAIIKDKLFFFGTYDGFRKVNPILYLSSTPTAAINAFVCPTGVTTTQCTNAKSFINTRLLGAFPRDLTQNVFLGKIDYQINATNHVNAVYNWQNWAEPYGYNTTRDRHQRRVNPEWQRRNARTLPDRQLDLGFRQRQSE